ncbi:MAG: hypothetical protein HY078_02245 [Elusimicrobia bacterium]|nr:hypothetical protein [Elusimicrobiota bacterium]
MRPRAGWGRLFFALALSAAGGRAAAAAEPPTPLEVWEKLPAPDDSVLRRLTADLPGLDASRVRELTFEAAASTVERALVSSFTVIDFFTHETFRGKEVFYLSSATLAQIDARYVFPAATLLSGTTKSGHPFRMEALLMGNGRVDVFYPEDKLTFVNPYLLNQVFTVKRHVAHVILGPGDVSVEGASAHASIFRPQLERITKTSPEELRVVTSLATRVRRARRIERR